MFDLSPCRTNSKASRYVLYSLPVKSYWFDDDHTNLTLQSLLQTIVDDLNMLATRGVEINGEAACLTIATLGPRQHQCKSMLHSR